MTLTSTHFTANLSNHSKMTFIKMMESLHPSIEAIMTLELAAGNKILEVRSDVENKSELIVLLEKQYLQDYENDQLTKLITTDIHDHGIYYTTKDKPLQTLLAPYYK